MVKTSSISNSLILRQSHTLRDNVYMGGGNHDTDELPFLLIQKNVIHLFKGRIDSDW